MIDAALLIPGSLLHARILIARGALPEAQSLLGLLASRALQHTDAQLRRAVQAEQARLALTLGDMVAVQRWANAAAQAGDDVALIQQEREALIVARWLIAQGEPAAGHPRDRALASRRPGRRARAERDRAPGPARAGAGRGRRSRGDRDAPNRAHAGAGARRLAHIC